MNSLETSASCLALVKYTAPIFDIYERHNLQELSRSVANCWNHSQAESYWAMRRAKKTKFFDTGVVVGCKHIAQMYHYTLGTLPNLGHEFAGDDAPIISLSLFPPTSINISTWRATATTDAARWSPPKRDVVFSQVWRACDEAEVSKDSPFQRVATSQWPAFNPELIQNSTSIVFSSLFQLLTKRSPHQAKSADKCDMKNSKVSHAHMSIDTLQCICEAMLAAFPLSASVRKRNHGHKAPPWLTGVLSHFGQLEAGVRNALGLMRFSTTPPLCQKRKAMIHFWRLCVQCASPIIHGPLTMAQCHRDNTSSPLVPIFHMSNTNKPSTKFPAAQRALLEALFPEYEAYIRKHNPDFKGRSKELTRWRETTAKKFMEDDQFKELFNSRPEVEIKDWEDKHTQAISRVYINHFNNNLRRHATSTPSASSPSTSTPASNVRVSKAADDTLRRGIVTFLGDLSARKMFASENEDDLKAEMDRIHAENPDLFGGALRNKALKILWDKADHVQWESKIADLADNVEANQAVFADLMSIALQNLCNRKRLGSTVMSFSWAFRDPSTDLVKGGSLWTGYDAYQDADILVKPADHRTQADAWILHADAVLPRKPKPLTYKFSLSEDGIPLLPLVNVMEASPAQVAILVWEYLLTLWELSYGYSDILAIPPIPWDDITHNPNKYFDISVHSLPVPLKPLEFMQMSPLTTYALYDYFRSTIDTHPFQFHRKDQFPTSPNPPPTGLTSRSNSPLTFEPLHNAPEVEVVSVNPDSDCHSSSQDRTTAGRQKRGRHTNAKDIAVLAADAEVGHVVIGDPESAAITSPAPPSSSASTSVGVASLPVSQPQMAAAPAPNDPSHSVLSASDPSLTQEEVHPAPSVSSRTTRVRNGLKRKAPDTKTQEIGRSRKKSKNKKSWWYYEDKDGKPINELGNPIYVDEAGEPMLDKKGQPFYVDLNGKPILG
ncbi:hypothetical protein BDZ97DRAFT_2027088 [Flammula alnicola]|nr:hypothetical protein BDZ97DRAFT_2027088 [Flammula alnicola]